MMTRTILWYTSTITGACLGAALHAKDPLWAIPVTVAMCAATGWLGTRRRR